MFPGGFLIHIFMLRLDVSSMRLLSVDAKQIFRQPRWLLPASSLGEFGRYFVARSTGVTLDFSGLLQNRSFLHLRRFTAQMLLPDSGLGSVPLLLTHLQF